MKGLLSNGKPELLIPASSLEVLKVAVIYGADAVYIGGDMYGLRAKAKNFSPEDMKEGVAFAHEHGKKYRITVATSDGLEQIIIRGAGCLLLSARELEQEIIEAGKQMRQDFTEKPVTGKQFLLDGLDEEIAEQLRALPETESGGELDE